MNISANIPVITVFSPLFVAILNQCIPENKKKIRNIFLVISSILCLVLGVYTLYSEKYIGYNITFFKIFPHIPIEIRIDSASRIFALCIAILWPCNNIYAIFYMKKYNETKNFFTLINITIFATFCLAFASNMITLFLAYETMTFATYPLINYYKTSTSSHFANSYFFTLMSASILLLTPLILYIMNINPEILDFYSDVSLKDVEHINSYVLLIFAVYGVAKCALFPMHFWLPGAMVAPTPVSALLHAVAIVKAGIFALIRIIFFVFDKNMESRQPFYILTYIASFSILYASFMAIKQKILKKRLAYSTISQLSYIIMTISINNAAALKASLFYIVAHAFTKITLFFCSGIINLQTGAKNVDEMKGVGQKLPITMICFTIATLSIIGMPFTVGFIGKYMIFSVLSKTDLMLTLITFIISTALCILYLFPPIINAFTKQPEQNNSIIEPQLPMLFVIIATTIIVVLLGGTSLVNIFLAK